MGQVIIRPGQLLPDIERDRLEGGREALEFGWR
jgi:hypothetical protein